jgi:hypothetical protein
MDWETLLDEATRAKLPPLYSQDGKGLEALAQVKFFMPDGWIWYASEGSLVDENGYFDTDKPKVDFLCFGLVIGFEVELGYFSVSELEAIHSAGGLSVEIDSLFEPTPLHALMVRHGKERRG